MPPAGIFLAKRSWGLAALQVCRIARFLAMESMMFPQTLGIDFGTSNTAAGLMAGDRPFLIEVEPGRTTLPTSVFFDTQRKITTYGSAANAALIDGREGRFMRALKSVLGTSLMHERRQIASRRCTQCASQCTHSRIVTNHVTVFNNYRRFS